MVNECKSCGATNMLMKKGKEWLCISCFSKSRPVDSELERILEDSVEFGLIYLSGTYKKRVRQLEKEKRKRGEV